MMPVAMEGVAVTKSDDFGKFYFGFKMHARSRICCRTWHWSEDTFANIIIQYLF